MAKRILLSLAFLLVACTAAVATPTVEVTVTSGSADAAPAVQATDEPKRDLPDRFEQIAGVDDLPLVQDGPGLWRIYDEEAQVVCYLYGANFNQTADGTSHGLNWSGLSCLPANETALGQ